MKEFLTIVQDVRRQIDVAESMRKVNMEAANMYADKIMRRAILSDCSRASEKQVLHASDICEAYLAELMLPERS